MENLLHLQALGQMVTAQPRNGQIDKGAAASIDAPPPVAVAPDPTLAGRKRGRPAEAGSGDQQSTTDSKRSRTAAAKAKPDEPEDEDDDEDEDGAAPEDSRKGGRSGPFHLRGQVVVITGEIDSMTREQFRVWLAKRGAKLGSGINGATTVLVIARNPGQSKIKAAAKQNADPYRPEGPILVMTQTEFFQAVAQEKNE
jgi:NAD-dependent DNA ligase